MGVVIPSRPPPAFADQSQDVPLGEPHPTDRAATVAAASVPQWWAPLQQLLSQLRLVTMTKDQSSSCGRSKVKAVAITAAAHDPQKTAAQPASEGELLTTSPCKDLMRPDPLGLLESSAEVGLPDAGVKIDGAQPDDLTSEPAPAPVLVHPPSDVLVHEISAEPFSAEEARPSSSGGSFTGFQVTEGVPLPLTLPRISSLSCCGSSSDLMALGLKGSKAAVKAGDALRPTCS